LARVIIPHIDEKVLARLNEKAKSHGNSLEAELKSILEKEARFVSLRDFRAHLTAVHKNQPAQVSDSIELLREDRDRDERV
jgi:plasmid stability protein